MSVFMEKNQVEIKLFIAEIWSQTEDIEATDEFSICCSFVDGVSMMRIYSIICV